MTHWTSRRARFMTCAAVVAASACGGDRHAADTSAATDARRSASESARTSAPPASVPDSAGPWLFAPDARDDAVHASDSEASLRARLGEANVRRDTVWLAEGDFVMGAVLYPDDARRRLRIQWSDTAARARPERVGIAVGDSSAWRVFPGIRVGTTLAELERLNGRPFVLSGFEWDYGGTVTSWEGGTLAGALSDRVIVRLELPRDADVALTRQVLGDVLYPSSHPAMRALAPRVYDLTLRPR